MFGLLSSLEHRHRTRERMDEPDADPEELRKSLAFIRRTNVLLGYNRSTIHHFNRFSKHWQADQTIRILDVATGSGDVPRAILRWAERRHINVQIVGVDLHAKTIREAQTAPPPGLYFAQADALRLPFADNAFDYAVTSLFLHHLDEGQIVKVLSEMNRVSSRGIIAGDLIRRKRAYFWISLFTLLSNPMVRHDGRASVAQALTESEILALRDRAGTGYASYHVHFGHRFVLAGEKPGI
jgi:2-polyprenyl-3-methyl-5-hydroxy-6-metoxy-1,4-benzoquinol methylase